MAFASLPSWLEVRPTDFLAATQAGAEQGIRRGQLGLEGQRVAQEGQAQGNRVAEAAAQHQLAQQELLQSEQRLRQEAQAHAVEQKQQQMHLDMQAEEAARTYQTTQQRQNAVQKMMTDHPDMTPEAAAIRAAAMYPQSGDNVTPFVQSERMAQTPQPIVANGRVVGYSGGTFRPLPASAYTADSAFEMTPQRINQLLQTRASTAKAMAMSPDDKGLKDTMGFIDKQLKAAGVIDDEPQGESAETAPAPGQKKIGRFNVEEVSQ